MRPAPPVWSRAGRLLAHRPPPAHVPAHRRPTYRATGLLAALGVLLGAGTARAERLADLLGAVAENARAPAALRADVRIEAPGGAPPERVIVLDRGAARYVEHENGTRALLASGRRLVVRSGRATEAAGDAPLGDTGLVLDDLLPFRADSLEVPQISDDGPAGVVVTGAPAGPSPWTLLVHTIDRERHAIVKTLSYRDTISNLARIRRGTGWVRVEGRWRPTVLVVESVRDARTTRCELGWRPAPDTPPTLFEPAGLERPSGLSFP